jgi:hypothetical protein
LQQLHPLEVAEALLQDPMLLVQQEDLVVDGDINQELAE